MSSLFRMLASKTLVLLVIRFGGAGAGFLTQLALARLLPPEALGIYFAATSLAIVASTGVAFGYPEIAPRFIARYQNRRRRGILSAFIRQSHRDALRFGLVASAILLLGTLLWPGATGQERLLFAIAAIGMPILAFFTINSGIALSFRAFFLAYGPETFLRPTLFLLIVATMILVGASPEIWVVALAFFVVNGLMMGMQWLLLRRPLPHAEGARSPSDKRLVSRWRREGAPQIAVGIYTLLFADLAILLAAMVLDLSDLAAFGIALKLALLVGFGVQVAHQVIIPDLADAQAARSLGGTSETMRTAAAFPIAFTLTALIATVIFGDIVMAAFHPDFEQAYTVLALLVACQVLRAVAGPAVQLLTIVGAQTFTAGLCIAATLVLALGNMMFVPFLGLTGAGLAVFFTWLFWFGGSGLALHRIAGMRCDIVALMSRREPKAAV